MPLNAEIKQVLSSTRVRAVAGKKTTSTCDAQVPAPGLGRWFDVIAAAAGLLVLWPAFLVVASIILVVDGWPVFFRQERVGLRGRIFRIWKLRTMRQGEKDEVCPLITAAGDPRVTRLGRRLRSAKLDEWPQLINVLAGQMSLIGPRPEVARFVDLNQPAWQKVLSVRPGITDVATLAYMDEEKDLAGYTDIETCYRKHVLPAKLALNLQYLERRSKSTDLELILLTLRRILRMGKQGNGWIDDLLKGAAPTPSKELR